MSASSIFAYLKTFLTWNWIDREEDIKIRAFALLRTKVEISCPSHYCHFSSKGWFSRAEGEQEKKKSSAPVLGTRRGPRAVASNVRHEGWVRPSQAQRVLGRLFWTKGSNTSKAEKGDCALSIWPTFLGGWCHREWALVYELNQFSNVSNVR